MSFQAIRSASDKFIARRTIQTYSAEILRTSTRLHGTPIWRGRKRVLVGITPHVESLRTVPFRWPVREDISSGCIIERSWVLVDQVLLSNRYAKKRKKGGTSELIAETSLGRNAKLISTGPPLPSSSLS